METFTLKREGSMKCIACAKTGKFVFASEKIAKQELKRIRQLYANKKEKEEKKIPVRAYYCEVCGGWHLTSISIEQYKGILKSDLSETNTVICEEENDEMIFSESHNIGSSKERFFRKSERYWNKKKRETMSMLKHIYNYRTFYLLTVN